MNAFFLSRMGLASTFLAAAILLLKLSAPVAAAEQPVASTSQPEMVIVPYDPTRPVAEQKPDQFYLPYEHFLELWDAAKRHRAGVVPEPAPALYTLSAARYEGTVDDRAVMLTGRIDLTTCNESWVKVPVPFVGARVSALKIDGQPAASEGGHIVIEKPGRHTVEVSLEIPRPTGSNTLEWEIPLTGATMLSLALPETRTRLVVTPSSGVVEQIEDGKKRITAALGTTGRVHLEWLPPVNVAKMAEVAAAAVRTQLTVQPGREEFVSEFVFGFPGARQDRFTVYLEEGLMLTRLDAPDVKSWRLTADGKRQALEVVLNEPVDESYTLRIGGERPLADLPLDRKTPIFSAAARRLEYRALAFCPGPGIELTPTPAATQRQVPWEKPLAGDLPAVAAFAGEGSTGYRVAWAATRREAEVNYVYQISRRQIELIASLQLLAKGDDLSAATINLPEQFDVQAIESTRLQDWWREGNALHLRFKGATPDVTPLVIYLVRQYPTAPTELDVRPLALQGFKKITGGAVLAAHKGVEVALRLSGEAREVAPDQAATAFQILAPLERKRGFTFKDQAFAGEVSLKALPAKTAATWVLHAQAHEGWVALSMHARLIVRQGSVDRLTFSWPAAIPEARVSGAEVRETRTRIEGDRRVYEVQFQNDVSDNVEWTADVELPNAGQASLPAPVFSGTPSTTGFVLTENASESEMTTQTSGVDPVPLKEIPFLPELSKGAGVFRVQPDWSVTLGIDHLEKAATRSAFVAWAEMTTALRRDGLEWHRAVYHLQNRALQFLPVKLPADAELMSARVAGENVRADTGVVSGQTAILVPLIKTKPGDLSYDVVIVYRLPGQAPHWWSRRTLNEPELLGITVERTFWNVWVPTDFKLQSTDGNMEPVLAEVNKADRLEDALQEWKALAAIANSPQVSEEVRANALGNCTILQAEIEKGVNDQKMSGYLSRWGERDVAPEPTPAEEAVGKKSLKAQGEYVARKGQAINEELQREVAKLKVEKRDSPIPKTMISKVEVLGGFSKTGSGNWRWNGTPAPAPAPPVPGNNATGNNVYFNDHIVLQQQLQGEFAPAVSLQMPAEEGKAQPHKSILPNSAGSAQSNSTALNTARGNRQLVEEEAALKSAPPAEQAEKPAPAPAAPTDFALASRAAPLMDGTPAMAGIVSTPNASAATAAAAAPAPAKPKQATGRVSLNVDFPTEGQEFHFKKVKANASLELGLLTPSAFERWKYLAFALVLALGLIGARRMSEAPSTRQ